MSPLKKKKLTAFNGLEDFMADVPSDRMTDSFDSVNSSLDDNSVNVDEGISLDEIENSKLSQSFSDNFGAFESTVLTYGEVLEQHKDDYFNTRTNQFMNKEEAKNTPSQDKIGLSYTNSSINGLSMDTYAQKESEKKGYGKESLDFNDVLNASKDYNKDVEAYYGDDNIFASGDRKDVGLGEYVWQNAQKGAWGMVTATTKGVKLGLSYLFDIDVDDPTSFENIMNKNIAIADRQEQEDTKDYGFWDKALIGASRTSAGLLATIGSSMLTGGVAGAVGLSAKLGATVGSTMPWILEGAGTMYEDMTDAGVPKDIAKGWGLTMAVPYAVIEALQVQTMSGLGKGVFKGVSKVSPLKPSKVFTGIVKRLTNNKLLDLAKSIGEKTINRNVVTKIISAYGINVVSESIEEGFQQATQVMASELAKRNANDKYGMQLKEEAIFIKMMTEGFETAKDSIGTMAIIGGGGAIVENIEKAKVAKDKKKAKEIIDIIQEEAKNTEKDNSNLKDEMGIGSESMVDIANRHGLEDQWTNIPDEYNEEASEIMEILEEARKEGTPITQEELLGGLKLKEYIDTTRQEKLSEKTPENDIVEESVVEAKEDVVAKQEDELTTEDKQATEIKPVSEPVSKIESTPTESSVETTKITDKPASKNKTTTDNEIDKAKQDKVIIENKGQTKEEIAKEKTEAEKAEKIARAKRSIPFEHSLKQARDNGTNLGKNKGTKINPETNMPTSFNENSLELMELDNTLKGKNTKELTGIREKMIRELREDVVDNENKTLKDSYLDIDSIKLLTYRIIESKGDVLDRYDKLTKDEKIDEKDRLLKQAHGKSLGLDKKYDENIDVYTMAQRLQDNKNLTVDKAIIEKESLLKQSRTKSEKVKIESVLEYLKEERAKEVKTIKKVEKKVTAKKIEKKSDTKVLHVTFETINKLDKKISDSEQKLDILEEELKIEKSLGKEKDAELIVGLNNEINELNKKLDFEIDQYNSLIDKAEQLQSKLKVDHNKKRESDVLSLNNIDKNKEQKFVYNTYIRIRNKLKKNTGKIDVGISNTLKLDDIKITDAIGEAKILADSFHSLFGVNVVFYNGETIMNGFKSPNKNAIYINLSKNKNSKNTSNTIGHEFTHWISEYYPDTYNKFKKISFLFTEFGINRKKSISKQYNDLYKNNINKNELIQEEVMANVIGSIIEEPSFLKELSISIKDIKLLTKIYDAIFNLLRIMKTDVSKTNNVKLITNINKAIKEVANELSLLSDIDVNLNKNIERDSKASLNDLKTVDEIRLEEFKAKLTKRLAKTRSKISEAGKKEVIKKTTKPFEQTVKKVIKDTARSTTKEVTKTVKAEQKEKTDIRIKKINERTKERNKTNRKKRVARAEKRRFEKKRRGVIEKIIKNKNKYDYKTRVFAEQLEKMFAISTPSQKSLDKVIKIEKMLPHAFEENERLRSFVNSLDINHMDLADLNSINEMVSNIDLSKIKNENVKANMKKAIAEFQTEYDSNTESISKVMIEVLNEKIDQGKNKKSSLIELLSSENMKEYVDLEALAKKYDTVLGRLNKRSIKDLTGDELVSISDLVINTLSVYNKAKSAHFKGIKTTQEELLNNSINELGLNENIDDTNIDTSWSKFKNKFIKAGVRNALSPETVIRSMQKGKEGGMHDLFLQGQEYAENIAIVEKTVKDLWTNMYNDNKILRSFHHIAKQKDSIIINGKKYQLTKGQKIELYIQSNNTNGLSRMMNPNQGISLSRGRHGTDTGSLYFNSSEIDTLQKSMSKDELDMANLVTKTFDAIFPFIQETYFDMTYQYLTKEESYMRMKFVAMDMLKDKGGSFNSLLTPAGHEHKFTMERSSGGTLLISGVEKTFLDSVTNSIKYSAGERNIANIRSVLWNKEFAEKFSRKYSKEALSYFQKWTKDLIRPDIQVGMIDNTIRKLKNNITIGLLSTNLFVGLKQYGSLSSAIPELGASNITKAIFALNTMSRSAKKSLEAELSEKYPLIWKRFNSTSMRDVGEALGQDTRPRNVLQNLKTDIKDKEFLKVYKDVGQLGMKWISINDKRAIMTLYLATKSNVMNSESSYNKSDAQIDKLIGDKLNKVNRTSQPMFESYARTGFSRNSRLSLLTMFTSATSQILNSNYSAYLDMVSGEKTKGQMTKNIVGVMAGNIAWVGALNMVASALAGYIDWEDMLDPTKWAEQGLNATLAMFYFVPMIYNIFADKFGRQDIPLVTPVQNVSGQLVGSIKDIVNPKGKTAKTISKNRNRSIYKALKSSVILSGGAPSGINLIKSWIEADETREKVKKWTARNKR